MQHYGCRCSIAAVVLFHNLFATVLSMKNGRTFMAAKGDDVDEAGAIFKGAALPQTFIPPNMVIISSPMEGKVSYVQLDSDNKAIGGVVLPIIGDGLIGPTGLAWDAPRSALYICDAKRIYRVRLQAFKCMSACKGIEYHIKTAGNRVTVVEGVVAQWVSVDAKGNLYFTDQKRNSVNKLKVDLITQIVREKLLPRQLEWRSQIEAEADESASESSEGLLGEMLPINKNPTPAPIPTIIQLYAAGAEGSPQVGVPAGVDILDGTDLYWTNQAGGFAHGTLAKGKGSPRVQLREGKDQASFPSQQLANNSGSSYGLAVTANKIYFGSSKECVYACSKASNEIVKVNCNFIEPRGMAWDGEDTVFVADQADNKVFNMPTGSLKPNAAASITVDMHDPFGVTFVRGSDPIWSFLGLQSEEEGDQGWASAFASAKDLLSRFR